MRIVNRQIFSRRSRSPRGSLWLQTVLLKMADEFTRNTFPFRFTIPPASLDPTLIGNLRSFYGDADDNAD